MDKRIKSSCLSKRGFIPLYLVVVIAIVIGSASTFAVVKIIEKDGVQDNKTVQNQSATASLNSTSTDSKIKEEGVDEDDIEGQLLGEIEKLRQQIANESANRKKLEENIKNKEDSQPTSENSEEGEEYEGKTYTTPSGVVLDENGNVISIPDNVKDQQQSQTSSGDEKYSNSQISNIVKPTIARITSSQGTGSGVVVESSGKILTAAHVVSGVDIVDVDINNKTYIGTVLGRDEENDIALVKISANNLKPIEFSEKTPQMGDDVLVFGHPKSMPQVVMSVGILNGRQPIVSTFQHLQTDALTHPGSSGGAWVDRQGKLIGIHVGAYSPTVIALSSSGQLEGITINDGFNFAVPANFVKNKISKLTDGYEDITNISYPPKGSTIYISSGITTQIFYNPDLTCAQLTLVGEDLMKCTLYKTAKSDYQWVVED